MMTLPEAQAEAAKWGNLIRALGRLQEAADSLAALEQNRSERQTALDKLAADIEARTSELTDLNAKIEEAKAQAIAHISEGQQLGGGIVSDARAEAADLLATAKAAASKAEAQATGLRDEAVQAQQERDAAHAELVSLREQIESAKADARARFGS